MIGESEAEAYELDASSNSCYSRGCLPAPRFFLVFVLASPSALCCMAEHQSFVELL